VEHETGILKPFTNALRSGSNITDMIPADLMPGLGTAISEASAATLTGAAAILDTGEKLARFDLKGASKEAVAGLAETAVTAIPFLEYASVIPGLKPRTWVREKVMSGMDKAMKGNPQAPEQHTPHMA